MSVRSLFALFICALSVVVACGGDDVDQGMRTADDPGNSTNNGENSLSDGEDRAEVSTELIDKFGDPVVKATIEFTASGERNSTATTLNIIGDEDSFEECSFTDVWILGTAPDGKIV